MRTALLHRLAFGIWAMEPSRAQAYYGVVANLLSGQPVELGPKRELTLSRWNALADGSVVQLGMDEPVEEGAVLMMELNDVVLKRTDACADGVDMLVQQLQAAEADPTVGAVVLSIDSPGGEGSGMTWVSEVLGQMKKPVVARVNHGMAASAAFGIAASCTEVYASSEQDQFGSIGTYVTLADRKGMLEQRGIKLHEVYASLSTEKNLPVREALKASGDDPDDEHYKMLRAEYIDPFNEAFHALVKSRRPKMAATEKEWNGGRLFRATEALQLGLIDGIATQAQVVQRAKALAAAQRTAPTAGAGVGKSDSKDSRLTTSTTSATTPTMKFSELFTKALTILGLSDEKTTATAEELTAANTELAATGLQLVTAEQAKELAGLATLKDKAAKAESLEAELLAEQNAAKADNEKLNAALAKHGIQLADKQNNLDAVLATLDQWAGKPGAGHTGGQKSGDNKPAPIAGHDEHMKLAASLPGAAN